MHSVKNRFCRWPRRGRKSRSASALPSLRSSRRLGSSTCSSRRRSSSSGIYTSPINTRAIKPKMAQFKFAQKMVQPYRGDRGLKFGRLKAHNMSRLAIYQKYHLMLKVFCADLKPAPFSVNSSLFSDQGGVGGAGGSAASGARAWQSRGSSGQRRHSQAIIIIIVFIIYYYFYYYYPQGEEQADQGAGDRAYARC